MPRADTYFEKKICDAVLKLLAQHDWHALTLEQIAKFAKVSPADLRKKFSDKNEILPEIIRQIDRSVVSSLGKIKKADAPHDRLFEILMTRFDILQEKRKGILALLGAVRRDPKLARSIFPAQWRSMRAALDHADLNTKGAQEILATAGLMGVYLRALCAWYQDETSDMAKTMAALDRGLRQAEMVAELLFRSH